MPNNYSGRAKQIRKLSREFTTKCQKFIAARQNKLGT